jgi:hypothetical protein
MAINQVKTNSYYKELYTEGSKSQNTNANSIEDSFKKALNDYSDFVKDRLENGEPSFQIGNSSMTEKEWDALITKVDTSIDQYKEELKQRIKVLKEREEKKKIEQEKKEEKEEKEELANKEYMEKIITEEQIKKLLAE